MEYLHRIYDGILSFKLEAFGGVLITGPKGCGKTTTAKQKAKSFIEFQDEDERENYLMIAKTHPSDLLRGDKPRLFDEWQDAPKIWGAVRKDIDDTGKVGQYILTGLTSSIVSTPHTGTLRISRMKMLPMSLYESRESNGSISIAKLFSFPDDDISCRSDLSIDNLKFAICRGGWPSSLRGKTDAIKLSIARDLFLQTCEVDISNIDNRRRNPKVSTLLLRSYARNLCTLADTTSILKDITSTQDISKTTYYEYLSALEQLMIVEDVGAWSPQIRSKTSIRTSKKRNLIDPSVAAAALGLSPSYFNTDYKTLGFLFECLCIRDLKIYSAINNGTITYYHDRSDLEVDAILHLDDGRYALIEFMLGEAEVEKGAKHLCKVEELIDEYNKKNGATSLSRPSLKLIITATQYGYRRDDGVFVIPIGCLRD